MYWRPVPKDLPEPESVSGVKRLLAERLWGHDGSLYGEPIEVGKSLIPYLEGIADAGSGERKEDAEALIAAIREHGSIELWIGE
jgi:hypothetical protein